MDTHHLELDRPKKASMIKMRLLVAVLTTLCPVVCYISRQNLPFAIVSMVQEHANSDPAALTTTTTHKSDIRDEILDRNALPDSILGDDLGLLHTSNSTFVFDVSGGNHGKKNSNYVPHSQSWDKHERLTLSSTCQEPTTMDEFGKTTKVERAQTFGPKYEWSQEDKGLLLGAFFYTYVLFQIPGARLAERVGAKWILAAASIGSALLSFISPWAASVSVHLFSLIRLAMGVFQAALYPSCYVLYSRWLPPMERSQGLPVLCVGAYVGSIFASGLTGYFSEQPAFGWEYAFYVPGVMCALWALVWILFASNEPRQHKYISIEEIEYIESKMEVHNSDSPAKKDISWRKLFTSQAIWAMMAAFFASNWSFTIVLLLIPTYLSNILHVTPMQNGMINSVIYVLYCIVSPLVGTGSTMMVETRTCGMSRLGIRKLFQSVALFGQAGCFVAIAVFRCDRSSVFTVLFIQIVFFSFVNGGEVQLPTELSVDFSGTIYAIGNCVGSSTGFIVPFIFGQIVTESHSRAQWDSYFYLAALISAIGGCIFLIFGQNKMQDFSQTNLDLHSEPHLDLERFAGLTMASQKGDSFKLERSSIRSLPPLTVRSANGDSNL